MNWWEILKIGIDSEDIRSMKIDQLKQHRKVILNGMKAALDAADDEKRDLSRQEADAFDAGQKHLDEIDEEARRRPANFLPGLSGGSYGASDRKHVRWDFGKVA